jgi:hypothetical protein
VALFDAVAERFAAERAASRQVLVAAYSQGSRERCSSHDRPRR